jgi:hypothetical protein
LLLSDKSELPFPAPPQSELFLTIKALYTFVIHLPARISEHHEKHALAQPLIATRKIPKYAT